jgi:hypothetical protein
MTLKGRYFAMFTLKSTDKRNIMNIALKSNTYVNTKPTIENTKPTIDICLYQMLDDVKHFC